MENKQNSSANQGVGNIGNNVNTQKETNIRFHAAPSTMDDILTKIEIIRKEKGIKQAVVAAALGVSQSAYSNYITRNTDIYYNRLFQIAKVLGVSVVDIITYPKKYIDLSTILENTVSIEEKVTLQIELKKDKKDQILKLVFGENILSII